MVFILSVEGNIGSGKSTILNYLKENNQFKILFKESNNEPQPYVNVRTNLFAKIDRKSFYRLIDFCSETTYRDKNWLGFHSNNIFFPLIKSEQLD